MPQRSVNPSTYDKTPCLAVPGTANASVTGWDAIGSRLRDAVTALQSPATGRMVICVECYPGVEADLVLEQLRSRLDPVLTVNAAEALRSPAQVAALVAPFLGGDDPVFGFMNGLQLPQFFDPGRLDHLRARIEKITHGRVLIVGCGAALVARPDFLVYADLARWEAQNRFRRGESSNLGANNRGFSAGQQYKRAFFIDWRVADRWKRPLIARWDYLLDTHDPLRPKLAEGAAVRKGLRYAVTRPFRVVPFFDPAPWGGQWMKEVCDLDRSVANYGWCFDCVPEENSLLLEMGGTRIEVPAIDLVFDQPRALLGEAVHARFGDEFPIRFDLLDTMGGGNLSFQVHPLTEYIQQHFGMHYTQDESYYLLDAMTGRLGLPRPASGRRSRPDGAGFRNRAIRRHPVSRGSSCPPLAGPATRSFPHPRRHGALQRCELVGPGDQCHPLSVYIQALGLGALGPGWPATPNLPRTRARQYCLGSHH
jgi:hypothetical protein